MTSIKKTMMTMVLLASFAAASASTTKYTSDNINAWISQTAGQITTFQNTITKTDTDIQNVVTLLSTMKSNLAATPNSSVQQSQIAQLNQNITSLQNLINPYAYTFTNNTPFTAQINHSTTQPKNGQQANITTVIKSKIAPSTASDALYKSTPYINAFAQSQITTFCHNSQCRIEHASFDKNFIKSKGSYDITLDATGNSNSGNITLTQTSNSGKNYTNRTEFKIKMTSKPKGHKNWKSFNLQPGDSTGSASSDDMECVDIYPPKQTDMPKSSDEIASLAPGNYVITYDTTAKKLIMTKSA